MSFTRTRKVVEVGDDIIIYLNPKNMYRVTVKAGEKHQNRYGALNHEELIGKPYGSKVVMPQGYVHILDITPDLWTQTLSHRTQILYPTDISMVLLQLDLKPGCVVLEAGTGSGSLSHSFARTIAPTGHLYTFDFHKERSEIAQQEFEQHGLGQIVTARHRDVCGDGIYVEENPPADAVFLDLPQPWLAIPSAHKALKVGGRLCCFSPCIEQVQKSVQALNSLNFKYIKTLENVQLPYEVRKFYFKAFDEESLKKTRIDNKERGRQLPKKKRSKFGKEENDKKEQLEQEEVSLTSVYMPNQYPGHTGYLLFATKSSTA